MSADFWAGYLSGAIGIVIGNPLDLLKTRLQAAQNVSMSMGGAEGLRSHFESATTLVRGATAPILGYGALNAILFVAYNRTLLALSPGLADPTNPDGVALHKLWTAGAVGGLASWIVSSPTELVKCRAQLGRGAGVSSWAVARDIVRQHGVRGLYYAGAVTGARDAIGYGFYFWTYELCKRYTTTPGKESSTTESALRILLCGGIAGISTWASVFPLDVIKTRLQAQPHLDLEVQKAARGVRAGSPVLPLENAGVVEEPRPLSTWEMTKRIYRTEGMGALYRGFGICSVRAFMVNAVQWATYEWMMKELTVAPPQHVPEKVGAI